MKTFFVYLGFMLFLIGTTLLAMLVFDANDAGHLIGGLCGMIGGGAITSIAICARARTFGMRGFGNVLRWIASVSFGLASFAFCALALYFFFEIFTDYTDEMQGVMAFFVMLICIAFKQFFWLSARACFVGKLEPEIAGPENIPS